MRHLDAEGFPEFYAAIHNREPFAWQAEFARALMGGRFPDTIDVPTGLGKTSVIDCWAYALAAEASRLSRRVPMRLFFVVDRRLVVDGAHEEALSLAAALAEAETGSLVGDVAAALRTFHGRTSLPPLQAIRMRGGLTWDSRWLARPEQPALVAGTVDQFGSRLLFRGYGVTPSMRPIDAALTGLDSWLVLDEAHIAEPLVETVGRVTRLQSRAEAGSDMRPLRVTCMSATASITGDVFRADLDAQARSSQFPRSSAQAMKRLTASKPAILVDIPHLEERRVRGWREQSRQLGEALADIARSLAPQADVVGVVANTVLTARATFECLQRNGEQAILLIGRAREYERQAILDRWLDKIRAGANRGLPRRLFVVATQTVEVGANIDVDALVTECAPLPALIQRFGRVNRLGDHDSQRSAIVHAGFAHDDDPVYGEATRATWGFLCESAARVVWPRPTTPLGEEGRPLDFGLQSLRAITANAPSEVRPRAPFTPVALGAHFERWAATYPAPAPDQDVAIFLHGADHSVPEVQVGWRAAPPGDASDIATWRRWLEAVRPVEWEFVAVPIGEAKALLAGRPSQGYLADVEGMGASVTGEEPVSNGPEVLGVRYPGGWDEPVLVTGPQGLAPGDRLVLDSHVGGHDEWGWTGERARDGHAVPDVGDLAPTRRRGVLRLAQSVFDSWTPDRGISAAVQLALARLDPDDLPGTVPSVLDELAALDLPGSLQGRIDGARNWLPSAHGLSDARPSDTPGPLTAAIVLVEPATRGSAPGDATTDEDEVSTSQVGQPVALSQHCQDVGETARQFGEHLGLPAPLVTAVELAGRYHDLGKSDIRFQAALRDGDLLAAEAANQPLAKSGQDPRGPLAARARAVAGLPQGFRHEAVSARFFDALREKPPPSFDGIDLDLVRHLIVSHHGRARPLLPPLTDSEAPCAEVEVDGIHIAVDGLRQQVDWEQPGRFDALCGRYGWWGLAFLESLVRMADMLCSEEGR